MSHSDDLANQLILIVEDEVLVAMEIEKHVQSLGYSVLGPAPTVQAAERLLDGQEPHAALLGRMRPFWT